MPALFGLAVITFWQAVGLLILSKILFGGFRFRRGPGLHWRRRMTERWEKMTPEQREQFREGMRGRCGAFPGRHRRRNPKPWLDFFCCRDASMDRRAVTMRSAPLTMDSRGAAPKQLLNLAPRGFSNQSTHEMIGCSLYIRRSKSTEEEVVGYSANCVGA